MANTGFAVPVGNEDRAVIIRGDSRLGLGLGVLTLEWGSVSSGNGQRQIESQANSGIF